jgi:hypothetical protein
MQPMTDEEKEQAKKGLCIWQTGNQYRYNTYCQEKATEGHLCAEHAEDLCTLYPAKK